MLRAVRVLAARCDGIHEARPPKKMRSLGALALSCMVLTAGCYDPGAGAVYGRRSWLQLVPSRVAGVLTVGSAWGGASSVPPRLPAAAEAETSVRALVDRSIRDKPERAGGYLRLAFHDAIARDTARGET